MNPIDKIFKEGLKDAAFTPPAQGFEAIQAAMRKKKRAVYLRKVYALSGMAAALLLAVALFWLNFQQKELPMAHEQYEPRKEKPIAIEEPVTEEPRVIAIEKAESTKPQSAPEIIKKKINREVAAVQEDEMDKVLAYETVEEGQEVEASKGFKLKFNIVIQEQEAPTLALSAEEEELEREKQLRKSIEEVYEYAGTQWGNFKNGEQIEAPKPIVQVTEQVRNLNLATVVSGVNQWFNRN